jgi:hypothetical protein
LCENDTTAPPVYWGSYNITRYSEPHEQVPMTVTPTNTSYRYCSQDMLRTAIGAHHGKKRTFPFIPANQPEGDEWMTDEQEVVCAIYGWAAVCAMVFVAFMYLQGWIEKVTEFLCGGSIVRYKTRPACGVPSSFLTISCVSADCF